MEFSRVELFAAIRRDARVGGCSIRELARRYRVGRATVREALANASPPPRKVPVRVAPKVGPVRGLIDVMLREDLTAPPKQRHTAKRVWARLVDEHGADISYGAVRDYVRVRRPELARAAGVGLAEVMVPQERVAAAMAEVDFGEVWVDLGGVRTKCHMFALRMSYSGFAVHRVYPTQSQEAFLEGHVAAFGVLGGVPTWHIRYDNLTAAVKTVLFGKGRRREENDRWVLFRSHYGFDAFYCRPGVEGAHEKGGVEGEVGRFRRTWLTPVPKVASLAELNNLIAGYERRDGQRRIATRHATVGQDWAHERGLLAPLPGEEYDPGLVLTPRVDRSAMITVRMIKYSVPAHLIGRKVRVSLRASHLVVFDGRTPVARHERVVARDGQSIQLDHYLEVLRHKPGALPGSSALAASRRAGVFTSEHEAFWAAARKVNGDGPGTRDLVEVLLLHRAMRPVDVIAGIRAALSVGAVSADVVALEARLHAGGSSPVRPAADPPTTVEQRVVSLTQRRLADPAAVIVGLPADTRPLPSVADYDDLLPRRSRPAPAGPGTTNEGSTTA